MQLPNDYPVSTQSYINFTFLSLGSLVI